MSAAHADKCGRREDNNSGEKVIMDIWKSNTRPIECDANTYSNIYVNEAACACVGMPYIRMYTKA